MMSLDIRGYRIKVDEVKTGWADSQPDPENHRGWVSARLPNGILIHEYFTLPAGDVESWPLVAAAANAALERLLMVNAMMTGEYINGDR